MDIKLIALDVDGTIAEPGEPVKIEIAEKLRNFEARGIKIALLSGKNTSYLSGLARGMGIKEPLIIGENGCIIFYPAEMREIRLEERSPEISIIESKVLTNFTNSIWLQPNQVELTIFPRDKNALPTIISFINRIIQSFNKKVIVFEHIDAIDILPFGLDKGKALAKIKEVHNIKRDEIIAVGDSSNDIPMFREAVLSIIIGNKIIHTNGAKKFQTISEALVFLEKSI
jgi:hypothetical protein